MKHVVRLNLGKTEVRAARKSDGECMEKKLRIGFASIEDASSVSSWSGIPLNVLNVLRKDPSVEVEMISPLGQGLKRIYAPFKLQAKIFKKSYDWKRECGSLRHFAKQIEAAFLERNLDVIFSTSSIPGTLLEPSIPFVFWTDATFNLMVGYYSTNLLKRTLTAGRRQEEAALRRAQFSCYSSNWAADSAKEIAGPARVKVLPFGPNLPIEHTKSDVDGWIAERRAMRPKSLSLLFVGIGWERKGGAVAVKAARILNDAGVATTLRVVGSTPPEPLPPFVESVGFINKREPEGYRRMIELYRTSDIFILPSRAEAFGVVVSEAAAFGMPALVCATGGLTETVMQGRTGFQLPLEDDGRLFAEKAITVLHDYDTFAANAYAEYQSRLNWGTSVSLLAELLSRAAKRGL